MGRAASGSAWLAAGGYGGAAGRLAGGATGTGRTWLPSLLRGGGHPGEPPPLRADPEAAMPSEEEEEFHVRFYVGHKGLSGHEFLEFESRPGGRLRYASNSDYKNDVMFRKESHVTRP